MLVSPPRIVALSEGRTKKAFRLLKSKETKVHKSSEIMNKKTLFTEKKKLVTLKKRKKNILSEQKFKKFGSWYTLC